MAIFIPYNPSTDVWRQIGSLAGGLMRDNYDQRGQAKALENIQDLSMYDKNMDTIGSLQGVVDAKNDYGVAEKAYAGAVTDEDKKKYKAQMDAAHIKATGLYGTLNMDGVNSDSTTESVLGKMQAIKDFNENMKKKYEDQRYKGMIAPGTVPKTPDDIVRMWNEKNVGNKSVYGT